MLAPTPSAAVISSKLSEILQPVSAELAQVEELLVRQVGAFDVEVRPYAEYVLANSGKRLRPMLALLAGGAAGKLADAHITLGVIVEMIHIATLVHDDINDEAAMRHNSPTANARWGNETAVLLGDCLFAQALHLAASYPTTTVCRKISEATNTVCAGEILQTRYRFDPTLSTGQYFKIIEMKTAALFAVSCELGAVLSGANDARVAALRHFGHALGVAYQIFDDCVDLFGQERLAGKSLGADRSKGKLTLPLLLLLESLPPSEKRAVAAQIFDENPQKNAQLLSLLRTNGALQHTLETVHETLAAAQQRAANWPDSPYAASLAALPRFLLEQTEALAGQKG
jgi:octaprenyl-diphosphate synthase